MSVDKEVLTLLRDTYLFFTISDSLEDMSDEILIQVYLRLLKVLDPNYDVQDIPSSGVALKHIYKSLRHLELVHLVAKASQLLDLKIFVRLCSALHDKITARFGSKSSLRIRKVVKAEDLLRQKKKRNEKKEHVFAEDKSEAKENVVPPEAAETMSGVGGRRKAAAKSRQCVREMKNDSPGAGSEEKLVETNVVFVAPLKGKELARTPVRPHTSDASISDSSSCDSPNTSASSLVREPAQDCRTGPGSSEQIMLPPPLDFDNSVTTGEAALPGDPPITPTVDILAVSCKRDGGTAALISAVNVIPSGRQIARTPIGSKLSGDPKDGIDLENPTSHAGKNDVVVPENEGDISKSTLHPPSPVGNTSITSDNTPNNSKDLANVILKPPPGFDSPLDAHQLTLSSSSDGSEGQFLHISKTEDLRIKNDGTYIINNETVCSSIDQRVAGGAVALLCETPEKLPVFKSKEVKTYKTDVDYVSSIKQPSAVNDTFVVDTKEIENKTYLVSPECQEPHDEVKDASFQFSSSFDDSDDIFLSAKKNDGKTHLKGKKSELDDESTVKKLHSNTNIKAKNVRSLENIDEIDQVVERRMRKTGAKSNKTKAVSKANFPSPLIERNVEAVNITNKRGRKKKPEALPSKRNTTPVRQKAVQPAVSDSPPVVRPRRQRNARNVNYCEISVVVTPNANRDAFIAEPETTNERVDDDQMEDCVSTIRQENVKEPSVVSESEAGATRQNERNQGDFKNDNTKRRPTRATRSKVDLKLTITDEEHSSGNKTALASGKKLKNGSRQNYPNEVLKSVDCGTSAESPKIGRRRGRIHRNDLQDIAEASPPVHVKFQMSSDDTELKTTRASSSSNSPESIRRKESDTKEQDVFSPTESAVQRKSKENRGRNKKLPVSSIGTKNGSNNDTESSSSVDSKKTRKTGMSNNKREETTRVATKKKLTRGGSAPQEDFEKESMNPSPPKRMRAAKSSACISGKPDENTMADVTKPKIGKSNRTDSPAVALKKNLKTKNQLEVPAAGNAVRPRPTRASKLKAEENITAGATDSSLTRRSQR